MAELYIKPQNEKRGSYKVALIKTIRSIRMERGLSHGLRFTKDLVEQGGLVIVDTYKECANTIEKCIKIPRKYAEMNTHIDWNDFCIKGDISELDKKLYKG